MATTPTAAAGPDAGIDPALDEELAVEAALEERHEHPSDGTYIVIALILAVLTSIEIAIYYIKASTAVTITLLVLMALKFVIVAGWFMHLNFDSKLLRRVFATGAIIAIIVYSLVLFMFGVFHV